MNGAYTVNFTISKVNEANQFNNEFHHNHQCTHLESSLLLSYLLKLMNKVITVSEYGHVGRLLMPLTTTSSPTPSIHIIKMQKRKHESSVKKSITTTKKKKHNPPLLIIFLQSLSGANMKEFA